MTRKVILKYNKEKDIYSDGDVEQEILKIFKNKNHKNIINKILASNPSWPLRYHLSPIRENILNWYNFNSQDTILEIGAGCGAITGVLCNKLKKVVANELSELRSKIIAERFKNNKNLTVIAGNLSNIELKEKFDYVSLIGVLEYAGKYTHTKNPFTDFLLQAKSYLKKDGTLIIAIENKFGLKYWAGCKEDHTGIYFDSVENYPNYSGIRTFGKHELTKLLEKVGFKKLNFYYPLPDYKLPTEIFSDRYLPTQEHNIKPGILPYTDYSQSREHLFDEKLAMDNIIDNKQFSFFSNSFLIFAKL